MGLNSVQCTALVLDHCICYGTYMAFNILNIAPLTQVELAATNYCSEGCALADGQKGHLLMGLAKPGHNSQALQPSPNESPRVYDHISNHLFHQVTGMDIIASYFFVSSLIPWKVFVSSLIIHITHCPASCIIPLWVWSAFISFSLSAFFHSHWAFIIDIAQYLAPSPIKQQYLFYYIYLRDREYIYCHIIML